MDRKQFLKSACLTSLGTVLGAELGAPPPCWAGDGAPPAPTPPATAHTCEERIAFAERWVARFMDVLDENLDPAFRARIMEANGQRCFLHWMRSSGTQIDAVPFDQWAAKVRASGPREDVRVEGNTITFQFMRNYAGAEAPPRTCLCDLLESRPEGISPTYCHCSVGYVRELFSRRFGRPVTVELLDSVLRGGDRCRFKVVVA